MVKLRSGNGRSVGGINTENGRGIDEMTIWKQGKCWWNNQRKTEEVLMKTGEILAKLRSEIGKKKKWN